MLIDLVGDLFMKPIYWGGINPSNLTFSPIQYLHSTLYLNAILFPYIIELNTDVESFCSDYQASEVVKILLPLALNCFRDFMSACGQHQEQDASLQLMYTSTLIQLVWNVFDQEGSDDQIRIVDIITYLPEAPSSLIAMLWGSSGK